MRKQLEHITLMIALVLFLSPVQSLKAQTWDTLPGMVSWNESMDFIEYHDTLIIAGAFGLDIPVPASNAVIAWDSLSYFAMPGIAEGVGKVLYIYEGDLYLGGNFDDTHEEDDVEKLAVWNGSTWERVYQGSFDFQSHVTHMIEYKDSLYVGGSYWFEDDPSMLNLLKYKDGSFHSCMPYNSYCWALGVYDDILYSGIYSAFYLDSGDLVHSFAQYNGEYWDHVYDSDGEIFAPTVTNLLHDTINHDFYIAGASVYRYDGEIYHHIGNIGEIYKQAMCMYRGDLFIGGSFTTAEGVTARYIARWDGESWSEPAGGVQNAVHALYEYKDELYVGGYFDTVGGYLPAHGVARYYEPPVNDCHWLRPRVQTAAHEDTFYLTSSQPELEISFINNNAYAESWQWSYDGGTAFSAGDTITNTYNLPGTYTASVEVTQDGCVKSAEKQIVVLDVTGVSLNLSKKDIQMYPNPVMSSLHFKLPAQDIAIPLSIYNREGKALLHDSIPPGRNSYAVDVHTLSPGNYIIKIDGVSKGFTVVR